MRERDIEVIREVAAEFLSREASRQSLITVTRVELSDDRKKGVIYITVLPESSEQAAVKFANRNRSEFSDYFHKRIKGIFPPRVEFQIDMGEKNRLRLDELSN